MDRLYDLSKFRKQGQTFGALLIKNLKVVYTCHFNFKRINAKSSLTYASICIQVHQVLTNSERQKLLQMKYLITLESQATWNRVK
jgi:hypothetical protein